MESVDAVVIGAGVIGLAITRRLALAGLETLLLDAAEAVGTQTSSRNSEVIHAGIYYPPGSLKAELCVRGREFLYDYCDQRHIPYRRLGKLIFAADKSQIEALTDIQAKARAAGVYDLRRLDRAEARDLEPDLPCVEALLSPSTGIINSHAYMMSLLGDACDRNAQFVPHTSVARISRQRGGWGVHLDEQTDPAVITRRIVNAAGLGAVPLAHKIEGFASAMIPALYYARGVYFSYAGRVPFTHLIYPVPVPGGLGTHLTLNMAGMAQFGPDIEWIERIDYTVDPARKPAFAAAAALIWPAIDVDRLQPAFAGIRPKINAPSEPAEDFRIDGPTEHGLPDLVALFGLESPGLTASLAIADLVIAKLGLGDLPNEHVSPR